MRKPGTTSWAGSAVAQGLPIAQGATPAATAAILAQVDRTMSELLTTPYCSPALVYDAGSGNRRYWYHAVGFALRHGRLWCSIPVANLSTAVQQTLTATTAAGGESGNDIVTHTFAQAFTPASTCFGPAPSVSEYTGLVINDAPASSIDRQLELPETLDGTLSQTRCSVDGAWSVSLMPTQQSDDLEQI